MLFSSDTSNQKLRKRFSEKLIPNITAASPWNRRRSPYKKPRGDTLVCKFLQGIWFHTLRKDGVNTSSSQSPERNCHNYIDFFFWKHESHGSLTRWRHRLPWHFRWSSELAPRLLIIWVDCVFRMSIDIIKEYGLTLKNKKQTIPRTNCNRCRLCRLYSASFKWNYKSWIPAA